MKSNVFEYEINSQVIVVLDLIEYVELCIVVRDEHWHFVFHSNVHDDANERYETCFLEEIVC